SEVIKNSKYITALTGAGVSVESGIRPFRGPGGIWTERGEPSMDGYQKFLKNPKEHWENLLKNRGSGLLGSNVSEVKPNAGHYALYELEKMNILKWILTQNIDDLHNLAGSKNILEIHGNAGKYRCINCEKRFDKKILKIHVTPPKCPDCGGIIKGDTVMFGEPIPKNVLNRCFEEARKSDCMIVAGTSAVVHPAASLPIIVKRNGGKLIEINPRATELSEICDVVIQANSGESLPALVDSLKRFF
ncbi:NAD-dependent deacylase, partial [Candidatus Bathyarchaeota archaeon]|nr:NAD-dependent deacylase [Candidatus Bathyarchaeota archaeon]